MPHWAVLCVPLENHTLNGGSAKCISFTRGTPEGSLVGSGIRSPNATTAGILQRLLKVVASKNFTANFTAKSAERAPKRPFCSN